MAYRAYEKILSAKRKPAHTLKQLPLMENLLNLLIAMRKAQKKYKQVPLRDNYLAQSMLEKAADEFIKQYEKQKAKEQPSFIKPK